MAAPVGNEYYKLRTKDGRDCIFEKPEELANACNEYFQFVLDNPFLEASIVNRPFKKKAGSEEGIDVTETVPYSIAEVPKMRPMTVEGLCNYIDIAKSTLFEYKKKNDFSNIVTRAIQIIENHQFEGAAGGFLNPNIIARKLGLSDKRELEVKDVTVDLPDED